MVVHEQRGGVGVGVGVLVGVNVGVGVLVGVGVFVGVSVSVWVGVGVRVGVAVLVNVGVGPDSSRQVASQPSPPARLPSSQSSPDSTRQLPQPSWKRAMCEDLLAPAVVKVPPA
jgi:hypothetical protein